jgi:hypothetical protein
MSGFGIEAYEAIYEALPSARVTIRVKGSETPINALCPTVGTARTTGDFGVSADPGVLVRMLSSVVPAAGMSLGDAVTLTTAAGAEYPLRIAEMHESGGMTRFMMAAKHGS